MKYYNLERVNNVDDQNVINELLKTMDAESEAAYMAVRNKLPREFRNEYEKCFFHDYIVENVSFETNTDLSYNVVIVFFNQSEKFKVKYYKTKSFVSSMSFGDSLFMERDVLLSELDRDKHRLFRHEFTVSGKNGTSFIQILFKDIFFNYIDTLEN